jgi:hypothetical protein
MSNRNNRPVWRQFLILFLGVGMFVGIQSYFHEKERRHDDEVFYRGIQAELNMLDRELQQDNKLVQPRHGLSISLDQIRNCDNVVTHMTVPAGGTVWGTIKAQIIKNEREHPYPNGSIDNDVELESLTKRTVDALQEDMDSYPLLLTRNVNHVKAGFRFDQAEDTSVSPVPGQ